MPNPCQCGQASPSPSDRLRAWAHLPHDKTPGQERTFENFAARRGVEDALEAAQAFAMDPAAFRVLVLAGPAGAGKSHLLEALARRTIHRGVLTRYALVPELLDELRTSYDAHPSFPDGEDVLSAYRRATLLILDDLGAEKPSPWVAEKLTMLVDERYRGDVEGGLLAVATNLTRGDVAAQYHERLASRLWDTATGTVRHVVLTAGDYRQA